MEYSRPEVNGQKPTPRSWHSSSLLEGNRVLIHGGFDGASNKVLGDSFIFDIGTRAQKLTKNDCTPYNVLVVDKMYSHRLCLVAGKAAGLSQTLKFFSKTH